MERVIRREEAEWRDPLRVPPPPPPPPPPPRRSGLTVSFTSEPEIFPIPSRESFTCKICHSKRETRDKMVIHCLSHAKDPQKSHQEQLTSCHDCNMSFKSNSHYADHFVQSHCQLNKDICSICQESFCLESRLDLHIKYKHQ